MLSRPRVSVSLLGAAVFAVASVVMLGGCGGDDAVVAAKPKGKGGAAGAAGQAGAAGKSGAGGKAGNGGTASGSGGTAGAGGTAAGSAGTAGSAGGAGSSAGAAGSSAGAAGSSAGSAGSTAGGGGSSGGKAGASGSAGAGGCASGILCGPSSTCCGVATECVVAACLPTCASGVRCGSACCGAGDACVGDVCATPTGDCLDVFDCKANERCEQSLGKCLPDVQASQKCELAPDPKPLAPTLLWKWDTPTNETSLTQAMSAPLVLDVDRDGTPDVIGMTRNSPYQNTGGVLRLLDGKLGTEKWTANAEVFAAGNRVDTTTAPAAADLDGDKKIAIVARGLNGQIIAFNADGSLRWKSHEADGTDFVTNPGGCGYDNNADGSLAIADLDGDGHGETFIGGLIIDSTGKVVAGETDQLLGSIAAHCKIAGTIAADVNGDGKLEIVGGNRAVDAKGVKVWEEAALVDGWPAVGDMNLDGKGELVVATMSDVRVQNLTTGALLKSFATTAGAGAPVVADFDGDGRPEIGIQHYITCSFVVYEVADDFTISVKWTRALQQCSGVFTATAFDFNGDGKVEVVTHDDHFVWILDGSTGDIALKLPASHGTWSEFVTVADVDKDGSADIIFPANNDLHTGQRGYYVYQDPDHGFMPTRSVWNQQAYHFTNIRADGALPKSEPASFGPQGFNNYRVSAQGKAPRLAVDFVADLYLSTLKCPTAYEWKATITNKGSIGAPAGSLVTLYAGTAPGGTKLAEKPLTKALLPGQSEVVTFEVPVSTGKTFYVEVTGKTSGGVEIKECLATNNVATFTNAACGKD